jgi:hypothetical protein
MQFGREEKKTERAARRVYQEGVVDIRNRLMKRRPRDLVGAGLLDPFTYSTMYLRLTCEAQRTGRGSRLLRSMRSDAFKYDKPKNRQDKQR